MRSILILQPYIIEAQSSFTTPLHIFTTSRYIGQVSLDIVVMYVEKESY